MINKTFLVIGLLIAAFFSLTHLTESPPTWMDEGIIAQVSRNMSEYNIHGIQTAPGEFVSAGFVTTGYPATFPVSLSYRIFGLGLVQARIVMVIFIFSLLILAYLFIKKTVSQRAALVSLLLIVSFAPIYGHGKNVLGEIPGLVYLFGALLIYRRSSFLAGILFAMAVVTKPIFLLLLPALTISLFFYRRSHPISFSTFFTGLAIPLIIWILVQFEGDSLRTMLEIYANPHHNDLWLSILSNIKRFVTESQPFYALILFLVWGLSVLKRLKQKNYIAFSETLLLLFSAIVMLAYLRTAGYYRYFFLAEFIALIYLPQSLIILWSARFPKIILKAGLCLLILFQLYQTQFNSFVADNKDGTRTRDLESFAQSISPSEYLFVYNVPEIVTFLKNDKYYQYMDVTSTIQIGEKYSPVLLQGKADIVLINTDIYRANTDLFARYSNEKRIDRYTALYLLK